MNDELGLNWLTFRHRNYMPEIGRFFGIDPVSEEYMSISTYQFAHNNPVWKIELEGLEGVSTTEPDMINREPVKRNVTIVGQQVFKAETRTKAQIKEDTRRGRQIHAEKKRLKEKYSRPPSEWIGADRSGHIMEGVAIGIADLVTGEVIGKLFQGAKLLKPILSSSKKADDAVVVIGEGMGRVKDAAKALKAEGVKAEVFKPSAEALEQWGKLTEGGVHLSDDAVKGTKLYKENQTWIKNVNESGKTILDIGNDGRKNTSTFYKMEQNTVYGNQ
jgi:RHS repeat-associated protein